MKVLGASWYSCSAGDDRQSQRNRLEGFFKGHVVQKAAESRVNLNHIS